MSDPKPTVFEAFSAVMGAVQAIGKNERNKEQGFVFRGIDTTMNSVGPALREHEVVIIPTAEEIRTEWYKAKSGAQMHGVIVRMRYTVYGPAGDSFSGITYGQASDTGDKAVTKAQSVAYRTFLLQGLTVPTDEPDPDSSSHERAGFSQEAQDARDDLERLCGELGINPRKAMRDFSAANNGLDINYATDPGPIRALAERYRAEHIGGQQTTQPDAGEG
ncbi:ERF family protein [Nocardia abscessus]|uniref:ERF family protein n=1 Tax=Nocardia abscessus TaxID=120957 RepID=UPI002454D8F5|nr:ERF family protein [Nocardia abscessus]